jgi:type II secretory pathway component PulJ
MGVFEMVIVIVFLSLIGSMYSSWLKHKRKLQERPPADEDRLARLEERVRVLERIVTDSGYELRRQFRDLERDA